MLFNNDPSVTFEAFDDAESGDEADDTSELLPEEAGAFEEESEAVPEPEEADEFDEESFEAASLPEAAESSFKEVLFVSTVVTFW